MAASEDNNVHADNARTHAVEIPAHGRRLIVVMPGDLTADGRGRLRRRRESDEAALRALLRREASSGIA